MVHKNRDSSDRSRHGSPFEDRRASATATAKPTSFSLSKVNTDASTRLGLRQSSMAAAQQPRHDQHLQPALDLASVEGSEAFLREIMANADEQAAKETLRQYTESSFAFRAKQALKQKRDALHESDHGGGAGGADTPRKKYLDHPWFGLEKNHRALLLQDINQELKEQNVSKRGLFDDGKTMPLDEFESVVRAVDKAPFPALPPPQSLLDQQEEILSQIESETI